MKNGTTVLDSLLVSLEDETHNNYDFSIEGLWKGAADTADFLAHAIIGEKPEGWEGIAMRELTVLYHLSLLIKYEQRTAVPNAKAVRQ